MVLYASVATAVVDSAESETLQNELLKRLRKLCCHFRSDRGDCGNISVYPTAYEFAMTKIAVGQMTATNDQHSNFNSCEKLAEAAYAAGASMLFLPEACSFIGENAAETKAMASGLKGPVLKRYQALAGRLSLWISIGGFQESTSDSPKLFNTHILLDDHGEIAESYRKIHLFDHEKLKESNSTLPGSQVKSAATPAGILGLMVCYDLRFPWLSDHLRFQRGCDMLSYPSAFTVATGEAHWEILLRARAVETQCYVIAAAQTGRHSHCRESFGHALVVDPWGEVVARVQGGPAALGIAVAEIDLSLVASVRDRMPIAAHRTAALARFAEQQVRE